MSVIIYTCNACNRQLEVVENDNALSLVSNCIITQNCKGALYKTGRRPNGVIDKAPPVVEGLEDYNKQGRMYVHEQTLPSSSWSIAHDLNSNPIVYVYLKAINNTYTQLEADDYVFTIIDQNNILIEFADNSIGIVHVVSRPNVDQPSIETSTIEVQQTTANTILTIATPILGDDNLVETFAMAFTSPSTSQTTIVNVGFTAHKKDASIALFNTPWREAQLIIWNDVLFRVRSVRITNILNSNPITDGSPFYFVDNPNAIILLSSSPYQTDTDIDNNIVYIPNIPQSAFTRNRVNGSELVIETSLLTDIFPKLTVYKTIFQ